MNGILAMLTAAMLIFPTPSVASSNISNPAGSTANPAEDTAQSIKNQITYQGMPFASLLGLPSKDVIAALGMPQETEAMSSGEVFWGYDKIQVFFSGDTVISASGSPEKFTYNGQALNVDIDRIYDILGQPDESHIQVDYFLLMYHMPDYLLCVYVDDDTHMVTLFDFILPV